MLKLSATSELQKRKDTSHLLASRLPPEYHSVQQSTSPSVNCRSVPLSQSPGSQQSKNSKLSVNLLPAHSTLVPSTGENKKTVTAKVKDMASSTGQLGARMTHDKPNGRDFVEDMRGSLQQLVASSKGRLSKFCPYPLYDAVFGDNIKDCFVTMLG